MGARSVHEASAILVGRLRRRVGVMAVRTHAEMKSTRLAQIRDKWDGVLGKQASKRKAASKGAHWRGVLSYYNHFYPDLGFVKGSDRRMI